MMNRKCVQCRLVNFGSAAVCVRCGAVLSKSENIPLNRGFLKSSLVRRAAVCAVVCIIAIIGFYTSLVLSASPLNAKDRAEVESAIRLLEDKGFQREVFYLRNIAVFRSEDNWLNAIVAKENAFAATNFPFGIVTLYPEFFMYPADTTERAAVLLHESKHLQGMDEKEAYDYVWRHRKQLGWTATLYGTSQMMHEVRKQTREYSPGIFICEFNPHNDCTE